MPLDMYARAESRGNSRISQGGQFADEGRSNEGISVYK